MVVEEMSWSALKKAKLVAVDTETSGVYTDDGARVACVAVAWDGGSMAFPFDQGILDKDLPKKPPKKWEPPDESVNPNLGEDVWHQLLNLLVSKRLVFHNATYDLIMLLAGYRGVPGVDLSSQLHWDTLTANRILKPTSSAGLDFAAREFGIGQKEGLEGVQEWLKEAKQPKFRYDLVSWDIIKPYVTADAETTLALYYAQQDFLCCVAENCDRLESECQRDFELSKVLLHMEMRGIGYNKRVSLKAAVEMEAKQARLEDLLPFKCTPQGAKVYFLAQGLDIERLTPKGEPSVDAEQVREWAKQGVKWAQEYRDCSKAKRAASVWYRGYAEKLGADGRLRMRYRQTRITHISSGGDAGARSGRLSAERVNLQAMPKGDKIEQGMVPVRDLLRAKPGHHLVSLDMSQAELRAAARYSECEKMLTMLRDGVDFHGKTTEDVMGFDPSHPEWKLKRDIGKKLTFGAIFGIGGEKFQALLSKETGIHLPLQECYALVNQWRRTYPEIMAAYRRCENLFRERGYVRILPGSEYESRSYLAPEDWPHTGWNRMVQGSLAAWLRLWLIEVDKELPDTLVLTVHDSIVLELPKKTARKTAKLVADKAAARATEIFKTPMYVDWEVYTK
jgi:DNA polymerase I-like protein with 3'-5' exonuclease and polymerase domains